jgi:hypothetical protein
MREVVKYVTDQGLKAIMTDSLITVKWNGIPHALFSDPAYGSPHKVTLRFETEE